MQGVRAERAKRAVGGRREEKAHSALLQNSKQQNSVVVQCVANYDHAKKLLLSCELWRIAMIYFHVERGQRYSSSLSNKLHVSWSCAGWSLLPGLAYCLRLSQDAQGLGSTPSLVDPVMWTWANPVEEASSLASPIPIKSRPNRLLMFVNFVLSVGI